MNVDSFTGTCSTGSGGGGGGTVTSITEDVNLFPEVLVNGVASYTITGSGTFAWSKVVQQPNTFWGGPATAPAAVPVFRALVPADGNGAFWTIVGNTGTNPGANWIGTNDAQDWVWKTSGIERGRVMAGGNVGIGNSVADRLLDVGPANTYINSGSGIARAQMQDSGGHGGLVYNVMAYGAVDDGTSDNEPAFRAVLEQMTLDYNKVPSDLKPAWGGVMEIPPGTFRFVNAGIYPFALDIAIPVQIRGSGAGITVLETTFDWQDTLFSFLLKSPAAGQGLQEATGTGHGPIIEGISFTCAPGTQARSFVKVNLANADDVTNNRTIQGVLIQDCTFDGANYGIELYETANSCIRRVRTRPGNILGEILFHNAYHPDTGDTTVTECDFQSKAMPTGSQIIWQGSAGLRVINNKFNGSAAAGDGPYAHILFQDSGGAVTTVPVGVVNKGGPAETIIIGNSFEGSDVYAIRFEGDWNLFPEARNIISNNQLDDTSKSLGGHRISIAPSSSVNAFSWQITNNNFERINAAGGAFACLELIPSGTATLYNVEVSGNIFKSTKATDTAILANAAVTDLHIGDNSYYGFTTPNNLDAACTSEGITMFGTAGHTGDFISCWRGTKAAADLKFNVSEKGEAKIRWASIGARGDQPVGFTATCSVNESLFVPAPTASTAAISLTSPRTDGYYISINGNSDVAASSGGGLRMVMNLNTAGTAAAAGTYTGKFMQCVRSIAGVGTEMFIMNQNGAMFMYGAAAPVTLATGGWLYVDAGGALHYIGGAGTDTPLAIA